MTNYKPKKIVELFSKTPDPNKVPIALTICCSKCKTLTPIQTTKDKLQSYKDSKNKFILNLSFSCLECGKKITALFRHPSHRDIFSSNYYTFQGFTKFLE